MTNVIPIEAKAATAERFNSDFAIYYEIKGKEYKFIFRHNQREDRWYFDLYDIAGALIKPGVKIVANYPFMIAFPEYDRELTGINCVRTGAIKKDPSFTEFGKEAIFMYTSAEDVEEYGDSLPAESTITISSVLGGGEV